MAARLGQTCRQARQAAGVPAIRIATVAGVSEPTVNKFESGYKSSWRFRTDDLVEAYESECGLEDGELWRRAIEGA